MTCRICFISCHYFGVRALKGILESYEFKNNNIEISLLITLDPIYSQKTVGYNDFLELTKAYSIPRIAIKSIKEHSIAKKIEKIKPDYILVIGWSQLLSYNLLDIPKNIHNGNTRHSKSFGCIGMHSTLLPTGRGRAPIPWTIIKNMKQTGVTCFLLEEEADAGGIILQKGFKLSDKETATTLYEKCAKFHEILGRELTKILSTKSLSWKKQNPSKASIWPKRSPDDGIINFNENILSIERLVRALTEPYPHAFFYYNSKKIFIENVQVKKVTNTHSGIVSSISNSGLPIIEAKDGIIECIKIKNSHDLKGLKKGMNLSLSQ